MLAEEGALGGVRVISSAAVKNALGGTKVRTYCTELNPNLS